MAAAINRIIPQRGQFLTPTATVINRILKAFRLTVASLSVIAKYYTCVNADQALLTGLLRGLGRLYIVMRAEEMNELAEAGVLTRHAEEIEALRASPGD